MKKLIAIALAMVLLLVSSAALGACGTGISQEDYDAVAAERDAAEAQAASIQATLDAAEAQVVSIQAALDTAQAQVASLGTELDAAGVQIASLGTELDAAGVQIASLQATLDAAELDTAQSQVAVLQATLDAAEAQIASLQAALDAAELDAAQSLAAVLQVTAKYLDVEVALADGYVSVGPCVSAPPGGMGIHYVNTVLVYAPINLLTPAVLLYVPTEDGLKLIGVEYIGEALAADNLAPWFMKADPPDGWATWAPTLFGQLFSGPIPGHTLDEPWHYDLHVWLWEENPSGMFADFNPNVSCPE